MYDSSLGLFAGQYDYVSRDFICSKKYIFRLSSIEHVCFNTNKTASIILFKIPVLFISKRYSKDLEMHFHR